MTSAGRPQRSLAMLSLIAVLTASLWIFAAPAAQACSCEGVSSSSIERAAGAVVGTIVNVIDVDPDYEGQEKFVAEIQVRSDLKDNLADVIYVTSEKDDGGNCGVGWQTGMEVAAAIYEEDGVLRSDVCSAIPDALAANWAPAITVGGEAAVLIAGDGPNRLVAYDAAGLPIAFAFDAHRVQALSVCPDEQVVLELVTNYVDAFPTIDSRSLSSFEVTSSTPAVLDGEGLSINDVRCDSPDGSVATFDGYVLTDGTFARSSESLPAPSFNPSIFWPSFETANAEPITGESWMWVAAELDSPVSIEFTGATGSVQQLGSGESFGLAQQAADEPQIDKPRTDEEVAATEAPESFTEETDGFLGSFSFWLPLVVAIAAGLALGVVLAKRKQGS